MSSRFSKTIALGLLSGSLAVPAVAQTPPGDQSAVQASQAIAARKAVYTLIGNSFSPLGGVLQGKTQFDAADALKRAERVALLASYSQEVYPEVSKTGNTKAKPEIWEDRAAFDKRLQEFVDHSNALVAQLRKDKNNADAFKAAATTVANDCKGCHDQFRAK
ncbi:MAG: cytochrome c [Steroidobacteraceae bacterium]